MFMSAPGGVTGPDGKVRICDLHPDEYKIVARTETAANVPVPPFFGTGTVTIADKDETRFFLTAPPRIPVTGEVVWDGISPDPPLSAMLTVSIRPITRAPYVAELNGARAAIPGKFSFEGLFVDDYQVILTGVPSGVYIKDVTYGDKSVQYQVFRPGSATGEATLRVVLARDGGTLSIKAESKDNKPAADAQIAVLPANAASEGVLAATMITGQTDQNGAWTSPLLAPGKYYVFATDLPLDRSPETIAKLWRGRSKAKQVDLSPSGSQQIALTSTESLD
jgi:hypothetical protein